MESASGCIIKPANGQHLVDGMSSWWAVIHGYNHPHIVEAIENQASKLCHVMFGGLTHQPAIELGEKLISMTPKNLKQVFFLRFGFSFSRSSNEDGTTSKQSIGEKQKRKFLTVRGGYHGDTFGAMSVYDPITGMHTLFSTAITKQVFANKPDISYSDIWEQPSLISFQTEIYKHRAELAGIILESIVCELGYVVLSP